jgi:hypothetical protein
MWNNPYIKLQYIKQKKQLIKIKHAPIEIQGNKPSIHNDSIINK